MTSPLALGDWLKKTFGEEILGAAPRARAGDRGAREGRAARAAGHRRSAAAWARKGSIGRWQSATPTGLGGAARRPPRRTVDLGPYAPRPRRRAMIIVFVVAAMIAAVVARHRAPPRSGNDMLLCDVALPVPLARAFTYSRAGGARGPAVAGARVICSFGGRRLVGVVLAVRDGRAAEGREGHRAGRSTNRRRSRRTRSPSSAISPRTTSRPSARSCASRCRPSSARRRASSTEPTPLRRGRGVGGAHGAVGALPRLRVEEPGALRGQAAAILAHVRAAGAEPTAKLETRWGNARAAVKKLAELGLVDGRRARGAGGPVLRRARDARRASRRDAGADRGHRGHRRRTARRRARRPSSSTA